MQVTKGICNAPNITWPTTECGADNSDCKIGANTYLDYEIEVIPKYKIYTRTNTFSVTIQDVT